MPPESGGKGLSRSFRRHRHLVGEGFVRSATPSSTRKAAVSVATKARMILTDKSAMGVKGDAQPGLRRPLRPEPRVGGGPRPGHRHARLAPGMLSSTTKLARVDLLREKT